MFLKSLATRLFIATLLVSINNNTSSVTFRRYVWIIIDSIHVKTDWMFKIVLKALDIFKIHAYIYPNIPAFLAVSPSPKVLVPIVGAVKNAS